MTNSNATQMASLDIPLQRDIFLRSLISELAGTLQNVVGQEEAEGFISIVGQNIGEWINTTYKQKLDQKKLSRAQVSDILIDLKARINGKFTRENSDNDKMVFTNSQCPFEDKVLNRPCMCMMTSNVFGSISADNLGYAKVELQKTIANGDNECKIIVYTAKTAESQSSDGREYFGLDD